MYKSQVSATETDSQFKSTRENLVHGVRGVNCEISDSSKHIIISAEHFDPTGSSSGTVQKMYACTKDITTYIDNVHVATICHACIHVYATRTHAVARVFCGNGNKFRPLGSSLRGPWI